ncbi:MAG: YgfZ/GcvT domain-containing protein [Trueperaceae bacterium]
MAQTTLQDFFMAQGGQFDARGRLAAFTSPQKEFAALETSSLVPLLGHMALRVTGVDRLDFVHGQLSNKVKTLQQGSFTENLLLNHKGHALAQMRVFRREEDLFLAVEGGAGAFVEQELRAHIVFDQVELQNLGNTITSFTLQGKEARRVLESFGMLPTAANFSQVPFADAKILIHEARRSVPGGFDIHMLTKDAEAFLEHCLNAGATLGGETALTMSRVEAGIAYVETEAGEGVLPQEAGLEHCVSYSKGCYLGQEIMARIEARGNLRRSLTRVRLESLSLPTQRDITVADKTVGQLGAVAEHPQQGVIALAVLRNDIADAVLQVGDVKAQRLEKAVAVAQE